jgi:hypothetical protein
MSTTAGYFLETALLNKIAKASAIGTDGRLKADFIPFFETVKAIKENSTMQFGPLLDAGKDEQLQVIGNHFCGEGADDFTEADACTPTCTEPSTNSWLMTVPTAIHKCFTIDFNEARGNELVNMDAYITARAATEKMLLQELSQRLIAFIEANIGDSVWTGKGTTTPGAGTTYIPAYWNSGIISEFMRMAIMNKFQNPMYLDGGILWQQMANAKFNAGNANGAGDASAFNSIMGSYYADLYNVMQTLQTDQVMYMIEKGAVGLDTKSHLEYADEMVASGNFLDRAYYGNDQWRWKEKMMLYPQFTIDVHRKIVCGGTKGKKTESFDLILRPVYAVNPNGCDTNNTGIIKLLCGQ